MTTTISSKAIALAGISVLVAGSVAVVGKVGEGYMWQIKMATAELQKSEAEMAQAKATFAAAQQIATASIAAAKEQAHATEKAARDNMNGMIVSSINQANGQYRSARESAHADNATYDGITGPMIADPLTKISTLNDQIIRVGLQIESGIDLKTGAAMSERQLAKLSAQKQQLEEERAITKFSASKNMSDALEVALGGMSGLLPQLMKPASSTNTRADAAPPTESVARQSSDWVARKR